MKKLQLKFAIAVITLLFAGCQNDKRHAAVLWNDDWKFYLVTGKSGEESVEFAASEYNDTGWEHVLLPHTAHIEPYVIDSAQWQGICWYRKHFFLSQQEMEKRLILTFDGAMNNAELWINGVNVSGHKGGFLPMVADITENVHPGENVVAVRLDNYDDPLTGPKPLRELDFNMYGGLYRNVSLYRCGKLYFTDPILSGDASGGIFFTTSAINDQYATVRIRSRIKNEYTVSCNARIEHKISRNGNVVAKSSSTVLALAPGAAVLDNQEIEISNPDLWHPGSPALYKLESAVICNDAVTDARIQNVGIRTVEFRGKDLFVNGKKTFLRGVNRHQDYPYVGYAAPDNAQKRDAVKIKEAGFDYVRLSHYPPSPAFLDACDQLGIFVLDAIPGWQFYNPDTVFIRHVEQSVRDMIRRDRNHPCVLAWEVSLNETAMPPDFIDALCRISKEEDATRATAGWDEYGYDIFLNARQHRLQHKVETDKPLNISEYGDWEYYAMNAGFNQNRREGLKPEESSSRQLIEHGEKRLLQQTANMQEAHNDNLHTGAFADGYWVMFDYNRGYAPDLEASGVMSYDRLPKFAYWFYQSQRPAGACSPMVHIASYWDANSPADIRIFSNCQEVELLINGCPLEKKKAPRNFMPDQLVNPPFTFHVARFEPGELKAIGYINGKEAAGHVVKTALNACELHLEPDISGIEAGQNDMIFIRAHILDENETIVRNTSHNVHFSLRAGTKAILVGDNPAPVRAGTASILLRTANHCETIDISAHSGNLSASCKIPVKCKPTDDE